MNPINILAFILNLIIFWLIFKTSFFVYKFTNVWFGLFALLSLCYLYIRSSMQIVMARPAHAGLIKFFGKKTNTFCEDGYKLYPRPIFSIEEIPVFKNTIEIETEVVLRDGSRVKFPFKIIFSADKRHLRNFVDSNELGGIKQILQARIEQELRVWAVSPERGPADWREARESSEEISARLAKPLLGKCLEDIPSEIPTPYLLKYFSVPTPEPTEQEKRKWGEKWEKLERELNRLGPNKLASLKIAVMKRRKEIYDLSQAFGYFEDNSLGIIIHGLSLGRIQVLGGIEEAAASEVRKKEEGRGSIAEFEIDLYNALLYMKEAKKVGLPATLDEAFQRSLEKRGMKESQAKSYIFPGLKDALIKVTELVKSDREDRELKNLISKLVITLENLDKKGETS